MDMKTITLTGSMTLCAAILIAATLLVPESLYGANGADKNYIRVKTKEATLEVTGGEVQVTYETGETKTYGEGDEIPPLPDGAVIVVLSGIAKLKGDNTAIELKEGDAALLFIDKTYKTTSVQVPVDYPGQVVVMSGGAKQTLSAGDTYWAPTKTAGAPTGGKKPGTPAGQGSGGSTGPDVGSSADEDSTLEDRLPKDVIPPEAPPEEEEEEEREPESDSGH